MNWHKESYKTWYERVTKWHDYFLLFPRHIGERVYWLEKVERRFFPDFLCNIYEYRIKDGK